MERRLAAILAADVIGYGRLMGDDEIFGDKGDDLLVGGPGTGILTGGEGAGTIFVDVFDVLTDLGSEDAVLAGEDWLPFV